MGNKKKKNFLNKKTKKKIDIDFKVFFQRYLFKL